MTNHLCQLLKTGTVLPLVSSDSTCSRCSWCAKCHCCSNTAVHCCGCEQNNHHPKFKATRGEDKVLWPQTSLEQRNPCLQSSECERLWSVTHALLLIINNYLPTNHHCVHRPALLCPFKPAWGSWRANLEHSSNANSQPCLQERLPLQKLKSQQCTIRYTPVGLS